MYWEPGLVAAVRRLRYSLALAGDVVSPSAVVCKGGVRVSSSPPGAAPWWESAQVEVGCTTWIMK